MLLSGTLTYYHIEWHWESITGDIVFTSGVTVDPGEVQEQQPFTEAQPVLAGTLYPVIKYMYVDGIKYSAYQVEDALWSPDLLDCLPPVIIDSITCETILGSDSVYPFDFKYINSSDNGLNKSRSFKIDLDEALPYFAISFDGDDVSDEIDIYYCTAADPLGTLVDSFISGRYSTSFSTSLITDLVPAGYPGVRGATIPRRCSTSTLRYNPLLFVCNFTDFTWASGDFIRIDITGSILDTDVTNTNWEFKFKCLYELDLDCDFSFDTDINKIVDTPIMSYDGDPGCRYKVTYNTLDTHPTPSRSDPSTPFLQKYLMFTHYYGSGGASGMSANPSSTSVSIYLNWRVHVTSYNVFNNFNNSSCMDLAELETLTIEYSSGVITFTFTDSDDYDKYKADYALFQADADYIAWLGYSDTDVRYYSHYRIYTFDTTVGCGDDEVVARIFYFWFGAPVVFNDGALTMTITCTVPANGITPATCDSSYTNVDGYITLMTRTRDNSYIPYAIPVGGITTISRSIGLLQATRPTNINQFVSSGYYYYVAADIHEVMVNDLCDLSLLGFCKVGSYWILYRAYDKLTLTDTTDHASRLANWRFERLIGLRTDDCNDLDPATDFEIIHEEP